MDSFNKVISFVLGLVVVIVFFLVLTGKINLKGKLSPSSTASSTTSKNTSFFGFGGSTATPTPTPTSKPASISSITINGNNTYNQTQPAVKTGKAIPSTGLPTLFIPTLLSGLMGGGFLSKAGKRKS